jgi:hypothetical protein
MSTLSESTQDLLRFYSERPDFVSNSKYKTEPGYMQQYQDLLSNFADGDSDTFKAAVTSAIDEGVLEEKRPGMYHLTQSGCDWIAENAG